MIRSSISPIQRRTIKPTPQGDVTTMLQQLLSIAPQVIKARDEMKQMHDNIVKHVSSVKQGPPGPPGAPGRHAQAPEIDYEKIVSLLQGRIKLPRDGKDGRHGKNGKSPSVDEILNTLFSSKRLTLDEIVDLRPQLDNLRRSVMRGGGDTVVAGSGVTITTDANGKKVITSSPTIYTETPTGLINGSNKVYTTAHTITTVIGMWVNGEFVHPSEYTVSGAGFTMTTALPAILNTSFTISYA